jgi:hypothetical protein
MTNFEKLRMEADLFDLWDSLCNACPMYYTEADLVEEFAKIYDVDVKEVLDYFF